MSLTYVSNNILLSLPVSLNVTYLELVQLNQHGYQRVHLSTGVESTLFLLQKQGMRLCGGDGRGLYRLTKQKDICVGRNGGKYKHGVGMLRG